MNDPVIKEAVNHEMEFSKSLMEWRLYEQQEKAIKDAIGIERYNRRIGCEEGRRAGLAEGQLSFGCFAKRNSFANYIKTDLQEGNLYQPNLYEKWFKDLEADYTPLN